MEKSNTILHSIHQLNLFCEEIKSVQTEVPLDPNLPSKKEEVLQAKVIDFSSSNLDKIYEQILNRTMS